MNVAVAGYGMEGKVSVAYWLLKGAQVTVLDEKEVADLPDSATVVTGPHAFDNLETYDMVVRTASLRPDKLSSARKVWSGTNEFFAECPAPIIGVTGTKGKGTTSSLIASMLRTAGKTVHLVGNIGVPALEVLPTIKAEDVVVFEMSSFQLWDLEKSPHIAVVLMIEPDHLDVHSSLDEYIDAKSHIAASQVAGDTVVYHPTNVLSERVASPGAGQKLRYATTEDSGVYVMSNTFFAQGKQICETDIMQVPGAHNLENACAAMTAVLAYDKTISFDDIATGLKKFTGLPHRLKFIREIEGVRYYDDSIATTPGSAIAALNAFSAPKVILLGGQSKGVSYDEVIAVCKQTHATIIAIGTTGESIYEHAKAHGVPVYRVLGTMQEAVSQAAAVASRGAVVILSPASSSFDQYANYSDRGNRFIEAVERL